MHYSKLSTNYRKDEYSLDGAHEEDDTQRRKQSMTKYGNETFIQLLQIDIRYSQSF